MMDKKFLGAIISPPDPRDYVLTQMIPMLQIFPEEYETIYKHDALDQLEVGQCVWATLCLFAQYTNEKQTGTFAEFSMASGYGNREPKQYQGAGFIVREALANYVKYGIAPKAAFDVMKEVPELYALFLAKKEELLKVMYPNRASSYAKITTVNEFKSAIMQRGMAPVVIPIYESFYNTGADGIVPMPDITKEEYLGNHCTTGVGWKKNKSLIVYNSWSPTFGDKGKFYLPDGYPILERWLVADDITPHPTPDPTTHAFFRVVVGTYSYAKTAEQGVKNLRIFGYKPAVISDGKMFTVQVGAFTTKDKALKLQKELSSRSIRSRILQF